MKKLYIIGGTMGVGKTTTCQILKEKLENSVFLDGDWCWDMHPFQVTQETKKLVLENITFLLNNFIRCPAYEIVIFCWVMHEQKIIDEILSRLDVSGCEVCVISLVCSRKTLWERLQKDVDFGIRTEDIISRSLDRLPLYEKLNTFKIDVSVLSPEQAAEQIVKMGNESIGFRKGQKDVIITSLVGKCMDKREKIIRLWFDMWLQKADLGIFDIFSENAVYIESWGPQYVGFVKIKQWFDEWNTRGSVLQWDIKQFFHKGSQTVAEWYFRNAMEDGKVEAFDGMSLIEWTQDNKICFLKEFGCNENHYDPYREGSIPQFRDEKTMWF